MAFLIGVFEGDFEAFKEQFDSDPLGRKDVAKGHTLLRGVENPNQVFVRIEFDSVDDAKAFRDKVTGSDVLQNMSVTVKPTVVDLADRVTY
jgi:heme-degrading monooxygenase HmoA